MPGDFDAALEWMAYEDSLCSKCGQRQGEAFDPANEERYEAELLRCHACAAQQRTLDRFQKAEHADVAGLYATVTEIDDEEQLIDNG